MFQSISRWFDAFSTRVTQITGRSYTFLIALAVVLIWLVSGPFFDYSDTWQLIINTSTTIVTFLMVFIIQQSQNKDSEAVHLKLNELLSAVNEASDFLIAVEELSEEELEIIRKYYQKVVELSRKKSDIPKAYSEEEAIKRVNRKFKGG